MIEQLVTEAVETYYEFTSDLFMCVTIGVDCKNEKNGLNELGYLFLRATQMLQSVGETSFNLPDRLHLLRMRMVVAALTADSDKGQYAIGREKLDAYLRVKCGSLCNRLKEHIRRKLEEKNIIADTNELYRELDNDFEVLHRLILDNECCPMIPPEGNREHQSMLTRPRIPFTELSGDVYHGLQKYFPTLTKYLNDEEQRRLLPIADELHRIVLFVTLVSRINEAELLEPLEDGTTGMGFTRHMEKLYGFLTSSKPVADRGDITVRQAWNDLLEEPLLKPIKDIGISIADYYNGVEGEFKPKDMLFDSINFVMCLYHYNHIRIARETVNRPDLDREGKRK